MPNPPQSNNNSNGNGDLKKDINLMPEDLRRELHASDSVSRKTFSAPQKKEGETPAAPKKPGISAWINKFKKARKEKPIKVEEKKKTEPPKFVASAKPALQVNVKQAGLPKEASLPERIEQVIDSPKPPVSKPEPPKQEEPRTPVVPPKPEQKPEVKEIKKPKVTKPASKEKESKHFNFSSIKEMIENDDSKEEEKEGFDVNLIPTEFITAGSRQQFIKKAVITGVVSIVVVAILYLGVSIFGAQRQTDIQEIKLDIESITAEIKEAEETLDQLADFTKQVGLVGDVLEGQKRWSNLFNFLEKETLPEIYYTSVLISGNNVIDLKVVAKSYHDLARQYMVLKDNPNVSEISMNAATLNIQIWEEYLAELDKAMQAQQEEAEEGDVIPLEIRLPNFDEMQQLMTVESSITFNYIFDPIEEVE